MNTNFPERNDMLFSKKTTLTATALLMLSTATLTGCSSETKNDATTNTSTTASNSASCDLVNPNDRDSIKRVEGEYIITKIVDGNTFMAKKNLPNCQEGAEESVDIIGVKMPTPGTCKFTPGHDYGEMAKKYLKDNFENSQVRLTPDPAYTGTGQYYVGYSSASDMDQSVDFLNKYLLGNGNHGVLDKSKSNLQHYADMKAVWDEYKGDTNLAFKSPNVTDEAACLAGIR